MDHQHQSQQFAAQHPQLASAPPSAPVSSSALRKAHKKGSRAARSVASVVGSSQRSVPPAPAVGSFPSLAPNPSIVGVAPGPSKPRRATSSKTTHSRSYPRGVGVDFRKLSGITLMSYIDHHGVNLRAEAPPSEMAVGVARHFESMEVDEEQVIGGFLSRLDGNSSYCHDYTRQTSRFDGRAPSVEVRRRRRSKNAARQKEQVAAKVTRTDENGSWILASVQRFYPETETYDVQDEDDTSKLIRLPWNHVMKLSTGSEGCITKSTQVMAIFPETTSFYRAVVSKRPVWRLPSKTSTAGSPGSSSTPVVKELILKFEDDEDENGRTPHRRVPAHYVIPIPQTYFHEDEDDIDLTPPVPRA
mmetsp:Transcript_1979/g.2118  ORF Transcript_1979/g.2118 Transcript_1979/m.2118 type:complete len:359 (-) Transcript_1979:215-1291(-)